MVALVISFFSLQCPYIVLPSYDYITQNREKCKPEEKEHKDRENGENENDLGPVHLSHPFDSMDIFFPAVITIFVVVAR